MNAATAENAARVGGFEVRKINFQVPFGTGVQAVLAYPGIFRIDAQCQNFGDFLDMSAATGIDNSAISTTAVSANGANDTDAIRDISGRFNGDFDSNEIVEIDHTQRIGQDGADITVQYTSPTGFTVTVHIQSQVAVVGGCKLSGTAISG